MKPNEKMIHYRDITATCPDCGNAIHLTSTDGAVPSMWWEDCWHWLFGAYCDTCGLDLHNYFEPGKNKQEQLQHIIDVVLRRRQEREERNNG